MDHILEIDWGNTCLKWRLLGHEFKVVRSGIASNGTVLLRSVEVEDFAASVSEIRLCSVRDANEVEELVAQLQENMKVSVNKLEVRRQCGGLTIQYADVGRLGVDRWLGMLASLRSAPDGFVMVDSGTAMTIDVVDASGVHQGGYIVPGLKLMRSSLELNTKIQLGAVKHGNYDILGQSTDDAVYSGTAMMSVSLIEEVNQRYPDLPVFLTGGDAEILAKSLRFTCWEIKADLVLNGFGIALAADSL